MNIPLVALLPLDLWQKVKDGDCEARAEAATMLDGVAIYDHFFVPPEEWGEAAEVSIQELFDYRVIRMMTLSKEIL